MPVTKSAHRGRLARLHPGIQEVSALDIELNQLELCRVSLHECAKRAYQRVEAMNRDGLLSSATDQDCYRHARANCLEVLRRSDVMKQRLDYNRNSSLTGRDKLRLMGKFIKFLDDERNTIIHVERWAKLVKNCATISGSQAQAASQNPPPPQPEQLQKHGKDGIYFSMLAIVAILFIQPIFLVCLASLLWMLR
ncbi:hypothetical protein PG993_011929 [Apiospora rasikravindrae]|uniref:Uncharacterized protein n=1 Tax=Apiospora rasikravindrae TaxID=990691 RepID=A0ABR1S154_9PEZI